MCIGKHGMYVVKVICMYTRGNQILVYRLIKCLILSSYRYDHKFEIAYQLSANTIPDILGKKLEKYCTLNLSR